MKCNGTSGDWLGAFLLTFFLHVLVAIVPFLPLGNYFFPFVDGGWEVAGAKEISDFQRNTSREDVVSGVDWDQAQAYEEKERIYRDEMRGADGIPYQFGQPLERDVIEAANLPAGGDRLMQLQPVTNRKPRSLGRKDPIPKLLPPIYSATTIPVKPSKTLLELLAENAEEVLLSDVIQEAVPLDQTGAYFWQAEEEFLGRLRHDIEDGRLDMSFAEFMIAAEFFQLSRILYRQQLQPAFTLEEAFQQYHMRLAGIRAGLPEELDMFSLIMILQRYAENKFYPENGSGMLLDGLFHDLNDCESGTKEVLSYLDAMYPHISLGSLRGMLQTTSGGLIGHMQVYIAPAEATSKIIAGSNGLVIETTAVTRESIQPYGAGEFYPLEDFVALYYPEIVAGTPLESLLKRHQPVAEDDSTPLKIVGTGNNPLKMSYSTGFKLLSEKPYDLENIRTRQLVNGFQHSEIPQCDPSIDPATIDRSNVFSNFVAIDGKLRKNLIENYLADMDLWDNRIMPQWKEPKFLAGYDDLAATLASDDGNTYIQLDADTAISKTTLMSHGLFLQHQRSKNNERPSTYLNRGAQECNSRGLVDDQLLSYLFKIPLGPGIFFLPEPGENFPWDRFRQDILNDCLAVPFNESDRILFPQLASELSEQQASFRKELYRRTESRGISPGRDYAVVEGEELEYFKQALQYLFTMQGGEKTYDLLSIFGQKHSVASTTHSPSVIETLREQGGTGLNQGFLWDVVDFMGSEKFKDMVVHYLQRADLRLTTVRLHAFVENVISILRQRELDPATIETFLVDIAGPDMPVSIRLAGTVELHRFQGKSIEKVSAVIRTFLETQPLYDATLVQDLLHFGLLEEDAKKIYHHRIGEIMAAVPNVQSVIPARQSVEKFDQLLEIMRSIRQFRDRVGHELLHQSLSKSLKLDFEMDGGEANSINFQPDYGLIVTKLYLLALLQQGKGDNYETIQINNKQEEALLFEAFLAFGSTEPLAKILTSLFLQAFSGDEQVDQLRHAISGQLQILRELNVSDLWEGNRQVFKRAAESLGRTNILYRMLQELTPKQRMQITSSLRGEIKQGSDTLSSWYLGEIHSAIAMVLEQVPGMAPTRTSGSTSGGKNMLEGAPLPSAFYHDPRVREAMALLAYDRAAVMSDERRSNVAFRKTRDLSQIRDLSKLKVIKSGSRRITRQDMSLLTLGLNTSNSPAAIAGFWQETLGVIDKHIDMNFQGQAVKEYLFSPHHPYLTKHAKGFFYPPETVKDLHNASEWGGKNDILLSSYLHFKNLPEHLPGWLVATAMRRSEYERRIINRFEQQTFYPMILECTNDNTSLADGLFDAKWSIRKPFGEDIFPGTLLLLRTGYMEIGAEGEIKLTEKGHRSMVQ